jgi:hypothetical protein
VDTNKTTGHCQVEVEGHIFEVKRKVEYKRFHIFIVVVVVYVVTYSPVLSRDHYHTTNFVLLFSFSVVETTQNSAGGKKATTSAVHDRIDISGIREKEFTLHKYRRIINRHPSPYI